MKIDWKANNLEKEKAMVNLVTKQNYSGPMLAEHFGCSIESIYHKASRLRLSLAKPAKKLKELDNVIKDKVLTDAEKLKSISTEIVALLSDQKSIFSSVEKKSWRAYYHKNKKIEASVLCLSDLHIGKINEAFNPLINKREETYNYNIYYKELKILRQSMQEIKDLLSNSYNLQDLYIFGLGDWIDGDRIFQGQLYEVERGGAGNQLWKAVYSLSDFFNSLKALYKSITIIPVIGNHSRSQGRNKCDEPIENNFEYNIFKILEIIFQKDEQIKVTVPDYWWTIYDIMGHKYFLAHGDDIKSWAGIPFYGLLRAGKEFNMSLPVRFDEMELGHFHAGNLYLPLSDKAGLRVNGCWIPKDSFGFRVFHRYSVPEQWFFGVNKKRSSTWEFKINLLG